MKASKQFVDLIADDIKELHEKHGSIILFLSPMRIYYLVHDARTVGHEHNAKYEAEKVEWFHDEGQTLSDKNIETAVHFAVKKFERLYHANTSKHYDRVTIKGTVDQA